MVVDKSCIAILDDNTITNYYNEDLLLEMSRFEHVLVYESPKKLLDVIQSSINVKKPLPGYFLVDIKMPEMDGFEFLDELEGILDFSHEKPTVFMLTTSSHEKDRIRFENSALANEYLTKPLMADTLEEKIRGIDK